ncbi:MAG: 16S rRNA (uracil(1498)-N(3))-methyltransferase [Acidimicrobiia bacterium]
MARHVPHLYVSGPWEAPILPLTDAAVRHLRKSLRCSDGDALSYSDGAGQIGEGRLEGSSVVRGDEHEVPQGRLPVIAVAAPANKDRVRFLVEKLAELGTPELWWLTTAFGEGRLPPDGKVESWCRSALEQSRSAWLMRVSKRTIGLGELPPGTVFADQSGSTDEIGTAPCVAIGPEGGWAPGEIPEGAPVRSFGTSVLRVETAAVAATVLAVSQRSPDH